MNYSRVTLIAVAAFAVILGADAPAAGPITPPIFAGRYDNMVPTPVKGRTIFPSIRFYFGYDDNIYTDENDKRASRTYTIEPRLTLNLLAPSSILLGKYHLGYIYYENRADNVDFSHDLSLIGRHMFPNNMELSLSNTFKHFQEPEESIILVDEEGTVLTDETGQLRTIVTRKSGDYDSNRLNAGLNYNFGQRISANLGASYFTISYEDTETARLNDRSSYSISASTSYALAFNPRQGRSYPNLFQLTYRYSQNDYDTEIKSSSSNIIYAQYGHWVSPMLKTSLVAGWEQRNFEESDQIIKSTQQEPYINFSILSYPARGFSGSISYGYRISETGSELFASRISQLTSFGLTQQVTRRNTFQLNGSFDFGLYKVDQAIANTIEALPEEYRDDVEQNLFQFGASFTHKINERLNTSAGWRFTEVDSDFPGGSYTRNRYYFTLEGLF